MNDFFLLQPNIGQASILFLIPFPLVDGSPNDQQLISFQLTSLTACAPCASGLRSPSPERYQTCFKCFIIAWTLEALSWACRFQPVRDDFLNKVCGNHLLDVFCDNLIFYTIFFLPPFSHINHLKCVSLHTLKNNLRMGWFVFILN